MKLSVIDRITAILLCITFVAGFAFLFFIPRIIPMMFTPKPIPAQGFARALFLGCWYVGVLCGLSIIVVLLKMINSIKGDPFIKANVRRLWLLGVLALVIVFATGFAYFLSFRVLLLLLTVAELLCALFAFVLCAVFKRAVEYRDENALVI
ncbi:DUF2975 domain-containing protein [Eubacteriales bacterium OttesenSCG-928-K08]|nr:DUF2975 domain-containing protein [Eubacteriales bacterium OttesenSCG-928-K08]